jgi:hypothetical protein
MHTKWNIQLYHDSQTSGFHSPDDVHTYANYNGPDDAQTMRTNLEEHLRRELEEIQNEGVFVRYNDEYIWVQFDIIFGGDWKFQDAVYGATGGCHSSEGISHCCPTTNKVKNQFFAMQCLDEDFMTGFECVTIHGQRCWRLGDVCNKSGLLGTDLLYLNSQCPEQDMHLAQFTVGDRCCHSCPELTNFVPEQVRCTCSDATNNRQQISMHNNSEGNRNRKRKREAKEVVQSKEPTQTGQRQGPCSQCVATAASVACSQFFSCRRDGFADDNHAKTCPGCERCTVPVGTRMRMVRLYAPMSRDTSQTAMYDFPKSKAPYCSLHALMRVSENLLKILQNMGVRKDLVEQFNLNLRNMEINYRIKSASKDSASGDAKYADPKLNGGDARKLIESFETIIDLVMGEDIDQTAKESMRQCWDKWAKVYALISKDILSADDVITLEQTLGSFAIALVSHQSNSDLTSLYLHKIICHTMEIVKACGCIGKFCNQAVEAHHKAGRKAFYHTGQGGFKSGNDEQTIAYDVACCLAYRDFLLCIPYCGLHDAYSCECEFSSRRPCWDLFYEAKRRKLALLADADDTMSVDDHDMDP